MISDNFANSLFISNEDEDLRDMLLAEYEPFIEAFLQFNTYSVVLFNDSSGVVANAETLNIFDSASGLLKYCLAKIPDFKEKYEDACARSGAE